MSRLADDARDELLRAEVRADGRLDRAGRLHQVLALATGVAIGGDRHRRHDRGLEPVAQRVEQRHVRDLVIEGVVERVAGDLSRGGEHAGDGDPFGDEGQRGQQPPLHLGRQGERHPPSRALEPVPVRRPADRQLAEQRGDLRHRGDEVVAGCHRRREQQLEHAEARGAVDQWCPESEAARGFGELGWTSR